MSSERLAIAIQRPFADHGAGANVSGATPALSVRARRFTSDTSLTVSQVALLRTNVAHRPFGDAATEKSGPSDCRRVGALSRARCGRPASP